MYKVVWPRGKRNVGIMSLAKRLDTLEGKTIGELWDWNFNGDKIFPMIEKELGKRFSGTKFVSYQVFGSTHGRREAEVLAALPDKLRQNGCQAVISGLGC